MSLKQVNLTFIKVLEPSVDVVCIAVVRSTFISKDSIVASQYTSKTGLIEQVICA